MLYITLKYMMNPCRKCSFCWWIISKMDAELMVVSPSSVKTRFNIYISYNIWYIVIYINVISNL